MFFAWKFLIIITKIVYNDRLGSAKVRNRALGDISENILTADQWISPYCLVLNDDDKDVPSPVFCSPMEAEEATCDNELR